MNYLLMFLVMLALDFCWARYTRYAAHKKSWQSACYSVGIMLFGAVTVIGYMEDRWMLIPLILGSFLGTFLAVEYGD